MEAKSKPSLEDMARDIVHQSIEDAIATVKKAPVDIPPAEATNVYNVKEPMPLNGDCNLCPSENDVSCDASTGDKESHHSLKETELQSTTQDTQDSVAVTSSESVQSALNDSDTISEAATATTVEANRPQDGDDWEDILGSGALMKRVLVAGKKESKRPYMYDEVTVDYTVSTEDQKVIEQKENACFVVGDGDVIQALEMVVRHMDMGEVAEVKSEHRFAYGALGREPVVPGGTKVLLKVTLLDRGPPPVYGEKCVADRLRIADEKRVKGNWYHSRKEFSQAINSYQRSLAVLDEATRRTDELPSDLQKLVDAKVKAYNNLAACQLMTESLSAAVKSCEAALRIDPNSVKALYRKGKCLGMMNDMEGAIPVLKKAKLLDANNKLVQTELNKLLAAHKKSQSNEKNMYKRMFQSSDSKPKSSFWGFNAIGVIAAAAVAAIAIYKYSYN